MVKGGKYLELLARADVLLLDKTGTLTLGEPQEFQATPGLGVQAKIASQWAAAAWFLPNLGILENLSRLLRQ